MEKCEGKRKDLQAQISQASPKLTQTLSVDGQTICQKIKELDRLLNTDSTRVNAFFRKHLSPIVCTPEKKTGNASIVLEALPVGKNFLVSLGSKPRSLSVGAGAGFCHDFSPPIRFSLIPEWGNFFNKTKFFQYFSV